MVVTWKLKSLLSFTAGVKSLVTFKIDIQNSLVTCKENITLCATAAQGSTITHTGCVTLDSMMKLPTFQQHKQP